MEEWMAISLISEPKQNLEEDWSKASSRSFWWFAAEVKSWMKIFVKTLLKNVG